MSQRSLSPFKLLRTDRDGRARAVIFDEWFTAQPLEVRNTVEYWLYLLDEKGLSETGAKSLLVSLIAYVSLRPDQQDLWDQHGEYIRAAFEWSVFFAPEKVDA